MEDKDSLTSESLQDKDYAILRELVAEKTGIVLSGERHRSMIQSRLGRRLRVLKINKFSDYCQILQNDINEEELIHFINAITTNVTSFFREEYHFTHLKGYLKTHIAKPEIQKEKRLRIWSAAASSGEEPYSIAMTVHNAMQAHGSGWDIKILATDLDTNILEKGREGIYPKTALQAFPDGYARNYTEDADDSEHFRMNNNIKNMLHFKHLNLLHKWPMQGLFDAIFCRNVFIYFSPETQKEIAVRFAALLRPGGILYIGHSENLLGLGGVFENIGKTTYVNISHD